MYRTIQSAKLMQAIIAVLIAGGVIFWAIAEMSKPAGRGNLKVEVADIRSNVSEASKIIEAATAGSLTAKYFQNETAMLQEKLANTSKTLGSAKPEPGLEERFAQARRLAESAAAELGGQYPERYRWRIQKCPTNFSLSGLSAEDEWRRPATN